MPIAHAEHAGKARRKGRRAVNLHQMTVRPQPATQVVRNAVGWLVEEIYELTQPHPRSRSGLGNDTEARARASAARKRARANGAIRR
jgi:hypothetical protein